MRVYALCLLLAGSTAGLDANAAPSDNAAMPSSTAPGVNASSGQTNSGQPFNLGLTGTFSFGGAGVNDPDLRTVEGGGHDPRRNGFTVQNLELIAGGAVDPYFDAQANIVTLIDDTGATAVELEEAYLLTRALPAGLQVKTGQYFTEFGRQNPQHPHVWAFVDQPIVLTRFFGADGLRSTGARVSWLTPLPWYSELYLGAQNAGGDTLTSFLWNPGETVAGHTLIDRQGARGFGDLLWSARWLNGIDVSDETSANIGMSALHGPNGTGTDTNTNIFGVDWYVKRKAAQNTRGFPFTAWQTEWLWRNYETPTETLKDNGAYTQVLWGYKPGWVAALRGEYATANNGDASDALRNRRWRLAPNLTWYPTEFSKLRVQYNRDFAPQLADKNVNAVWMQYEFSLGAHAAHQF